MTSKPTSQPLITQTYIEADAPGFWEAVLMLYRHDTTWRSAVDLLVIGSVMLCIAGSPPQWVSNLFSGDPANIANTAHNSPVPPVTGTSAPAAPAANFSPPQPQNLNKKVAPSVPISDNLPDFVRSKKWFTRLNADDEALLLEIYTDVSHFNYESAVQKATPLAEAGNSDFQYALAISYVGYETDNTHKKKAFYWQKEAALTENPYAQYELAQYYRLGFGVIPNPQEAVSWYERAVKNGHPGAANELGRMYESGNAVALSILKAFEYYKIGAEGGDKMAQSNLSAIYYNGSLGKRDYVKAYEWIKKSAEQGHAIAQLSLAQMYYRGKIGNVIDYRNFELWIAKAADQGNIEAMLALADYYREGVSGKPDNQLAAQWYRRGALKKNAKAQFMLARMYEEGSGVPQDKIQAYVYYSLANRGAYGQAGHALTALQKTMRPSEQEHAEALATAISEK